MTGNTAKRKCGNAAARQSGDLGRPPGVPGAEEGEVRTVDYPLAHQEALLQALHRALNTDPIPPCADANTVVAQARDDTTQLYASELQQCDQQRRITDALITELDRGSGAVSPGVDG